MIAGTTVQLIEVIIIYLVYYSSGIFLWDFSYHLCVVDCWHVCSHWLYQHSLIQKRFLGCVRKLSVSRIQTGYMDLLPPKVCQSSWQGFWLGIQTCLVQLIAFLYIKYQSISLFRPYFVDCWLVCIIFIVSVFIDTETFPGVC